MVKGYIKTGREIKKEYGALMGDASGYKTKNNTFFEDTKKNKDEEKKTPDKVSANKSKNFKP